MQLSYYYDITLCFSIFVFPSDISSIAFIKNVDVLVFYKKCYICFYNQIKRLRNCIVFLSFLSKDSLQIELICLSVYSKIDSQIRVQLIERMKN